MVKGIDISSYWSPVFGKNAGDSRVSILCRAHLSCQRPAPFVEIDHRQHGEGPVGVLGEAAITHLGKAPETLARQERMFDLGTDAGLAPVRGFIGLGQRTVLVGPLIGEVFGLRRQFSETFPLRLTPVGAIESNRPGFRRGSVV